MTRANQNQLHAQLKAATDPDKRRSLALNLLAVTYSRQMIDEALHALEHLPPDDSARPVLREKALYYLEHSEKDSGALIREKLMRLLAVIGSPDDADIYRRGARVYALMPVLDHGQTCRAAALVGLATADRKLACVYATLLLGEPHTAQLSGEPSLTAISVLARFDERLPIAAFIQRQGEDFARRAMGEVVGRAFEQLGPEFPASEFAALAEPFVALDEPPVNAGILTYIIDNRAETLYPLLGRILDDTRDDGLLYFGLMALAAARDDALTTLLYERAKHCARGDVRTYIEAAALTAHPDREAVLEGLTRRL